MSEKIVSKGIFCCDTFILDKTNKLSLIGIFNDIKVAKIPITHSKMSFVAILKIEDANSDSYNVDVKLKSPRDSELAEFKIKGKIDEKEGNVNVVVDINNFVFKEFGKHTFEIYINEKFIDSTSIEVKEEK